MRAQEKKTKGFTLLELIVVVVIIGIVSGLGWTPFQNWRSDRLVRSEAVKISGLVRDIFSQVQRGHYSFVQFQITEEKGKVTLSSNGMKTEKFTELVRNKYNSGGGKEPFHEFHTRCNDEITWDDEGLDSDKLTVNSYEIDENLSLVVPEKNTIEGVVCFSKDGSYYAAGGAFLEGGGPEAQAIEKLYICSGTSGCEIDAAGDTSQENFFKISWSRFGNVGFDKLFDREWVAQ